MSAPVIPSLTKRGQHKHNDALKSLQVPFLSYLFHFILNMPFLNNLLTNGMTVPKTSADYRVNWIHKLNQEYLMIMAWVVN